MGQRLTGDVLMPFVHQSQLRKELGDSHCTAESAHLPTILMRRAKTCNMRTSGTCFLGITLTFLVVPALGRNTYGISRTHHEPGMHSGVLGLLDRLSPSRTRTTRESAADLFDFLHSAENEHENISPDLMLLGEDEDISDDKRGMGWLLEWTGFKCVSSRTTSMLESISDAFSNDCRHMARIQTRVRKFLDEVLDHCGKSSSVKHFLRNIVSRIFSECEIQENMDEGLRWVRKAADNI
ncbi:uncharacterized protein [Periplaneta americana]|uniref:uncharacterized protein n=1 Tax=Periplaneta americana TaxID=6978 RepID=UPI0037E7741B